MAYSIEIYFHSSYRYSKNFVISYRDVDSFSKILKRLIIVFTTTTVISGCNQESHRCSITVIVVYNWHEENGCLYYWIAVFMLFKVSLLNGFKCLAFPMSRYHCSYSWTKVYIFIKLPCTERVARLLILENIIHVILKW